MHFESSERVRPVSMRSIPSRRLSRHRGPVYLAIVVSRNLPYTRRFFGARHPLCGIGVTSEILVILNPALFSARTADSLPGPGPFTITSKFFRPNSATASHTLTAAICAANGVLFRDPLNPLAPAVDHANAFPCRSVTVIRVLLKDACTCAIPSLTVLRTRFFARTFDFAIVVIRTLSLDGSAWTLSSPGVGVGPLTSHRQAPTMTNTPITP